MTLNQERLKEILDLDVSASVFTRKTSGNGFNKGDVAGCVNNRGYVHIRIAGKKYLAHRLVWLWVYGEWPKGQLDHLSGDKLDNRISNLKDVTCRENQQNQSRHRNGRLVGCYFHKQTSKWCARIKIEGSMKYLGLYPTELEAHNAYMSALNQFQLQA
jgi:hypothetical protein